MYDDFDDFYDDFDSEYEYYRESTGHITNFDKWKNPSYEAAIAEYKAVKPETDLHVAEGYKWPGTLGLYGSVNGDLGPFWRIFEKHDEALRKQRSDSPQTYQQEK